MNYRFACLLSALVGYISLSQEIIWVRLVSFATGGLPSTFAHVLGVFLLGIAAGAFTAGKIKQTDDSRLAVTVVSILALSSLVYFISIPATASVYGSMGSAGKALTYVWVGALAFLNGLVFPLLCQVGITRTKAVGSSLSGIYFWNIVGSVFGPLLTTFILMDKLSTGQVVTVITTLGLASALLCAFLLSVPAKKRILLAAACCSAAAIIFMTHSSLYSDILAKFQFKKDYLKNPYVSVAENRSGVVSVTKVNGDYVIYGGGIYDGEFSTDPVKNSNSIRRAYQMASLHREPTDVLEIGLSSGSWATVIANHAKAKNLTIVEINPAYEQTMEDFKEQAAILSNPKTKIIYDDGRRWLNRNPQAKFDFILMNTTFHWRSNITSLLSKEFLELCKSHLKPGGVVYYNATFSEDVVHTASRVFKHVTRFLSFVAASDNPFTLTFEERRANLLAFTSQGKQVFDETNPTSNSILTELANYPLPDVAQEYRQRQDLWLITDDNMATEYKRHKLYDPQANWLASWLRIEAKTRAASE